MTKKKLTGYDRYILGKEGLDFEVDEKRLDEKALRREIARAIDLGNKGNLNSEEKKVLGTLISEAISSGILTKEKLARMRSGEYQTKRRVKEIIEEVMIKNLQGPERDKIYKEIEQSKSKGLVTDRFVQKEESEARLKAHLRHRYQEMKARQSEVTKSKIKANRPKKTWGNRRIIRRIRYG